jgi:hypothetical protein
MRALVAGSTSISLWCADINLHASGKSGTPYRGDLSPAEIGDPDFAKRVAQPQVPR